MIDLDPFTATNTYADVLDALPIIAYIGRLDGSISYVSPAWERFTGIAAAQVYAAGYADAVHPHDLAGVVAAWDAARAAGGTFRYEFRLKAGRAHRWVLSQAEPVRDARGRAFAWVGSLVDIDDLRATEVQLGVAFATLQRTASDADERARFIERLLDASDDCITVLDLDARLVSMSENGRRALAITAFAAVEGIDWRAFWTGDDRADADAAIETARGGGTARFTGRSPVQGRDAWWECTVSPILDARGRPERFLVVSRDVTASLATRRTLEASEAYHRLLTQAIPGSVWTARADGSIDRVANPEASKLDPAADLTGDAWLAALHPDDRERATATWAAAVASGEPYEIAYRVADETGAHRWKLARALSQRDAAGAVSHWVGVTLDVDEQYRLDERRAEFVRLVEASDDCIAIGSLAGMDYVNAAGLAMLEIGSLDEARRTPVFDFFAANERAHVARDLVPLLERDGRVAAETRLRTFRSESSLPVSCSVFSLDPGGVGMNRLAFVGRDLRKRQRRSAGFDALAKTGELLFGSLDFGRTARNLATAVTRGFATCCVIDTLAVGSSPPLTVFEHIDPAMTAALGRLADTRDLAGRGATARALRDGASTLVADMPASYVDRRGLDPELAARLRELDFRSMICVPIADRSHAIVGALTCFVDGRDARGGYTEDDRRFAEALARQAGLALENARLYERERRIAVELQEASLSRTLPAVDHLTLSAEYRPSGDEATIGGDWYDAFELDDGRVAITIGDVLGHGLRSAVVMGKVRQAMRAVATVLPDPNAMLDVADRTVRAESDDTYATAHAGIFDPATHAYTFASAGHPGPLLLRPDGEIETYALPGLLLGMRERGGRDTVVVPTPPGSTVAFFTDGLLEATRDLDEGTRRVTAALRDPATTRSANPAASLVEHVLRGEPAGDDVAVLIARVAPEPPA